MTPKPAQIVVLSFSDVGGGDLEGVLVFDDLVVGVGAEGVDVGVCLPSADGRWGDGGRDPHPE